MSQEQQELVEQAAPEVTAEAPVILDDAVSEAPVTPTASVAPSTDDTPKAGGKKRTRKKARPVSEEEISPKSSIWPLALAVAIFVMLLGILIHPAVLGLGVVLVIAAFIGWGVERR